MAVPSTSFKTKQSTSRVFVIFACIIAIVYLFSWTAMHLTFLGCRISSDWTTNESPQLGSIAERKRVSIPPDENLFVKPPLFNPWRDFVFSDLTITNKTDHYSSHSCVAAASTDRRKDHVSRTCHYQNLYYHVPTKKWHYFPNPSERLVFQRDRNRVNDMDVNIWHVREAFVDKLVDRISVPYRPEVHLVDAIPRGAELRKDSYDDQEAVSSTGQVDQHSQRTPSGTILQHSRPTFTQNKTVVLSMSNGMRPIFVVYKGSMANFGHFIWDDYLSIYSQLDLLDLADDDQVMPIPFVQDDNLGGSFCSADNGYVYKECTGFMKRMYPSLWNIDTDCSGDVVRTGNWLQGTRSIGAWSQHPHERCGDYRDNITNVIDAEYVLVPNVTVGSGRLALFSCYGDCTLGRGPQLFRFRNFLMRRMLGHAHAINPKGYITFSLAHGASRGKGEVSFFENEIAAAKLRYGEQAVKAVDLATLTLEAQAELIANSAVLFTNHGGGSASTVFLPKGASAFLYWAGQQRDIEFYRSVAYFRTEWIESRERQDVARTMRLLEMELIKTAAMYPNMICFENVSLDV